MKMWYQQRNKNRTMEQNTELKNRSIHIQSFDWSKDKLYDGRGKKMIFLTNCAGPVEYPYGK